MHANSDPIHKPRGGFWRALCLCASKAGQFGLYEGVPLGSVCGMFPGISVLPMCALTKRRHRRSFCQICKWSTGRHSNQHSLVVRNQLNDGTCVNSPCLQQVKNSQLVSIKRQLCWIVLFIVLITEKLSPICFGVEQKNCLTHTNHNWVAVSSSQQNICLNLWLVPKHEKMQWGIDRIETSAEI